jgi:hypothetical protein
MNGSTLLRFAGASVFALAIAACSNDGTGLDSELTLEESADAAETVGDAAAEDVAQWFEGEGTMGAGGVGPSVGVEGAAAIGDMCPFDAATGRFVCPTVVREGLTFNRSFALFDAQSQPMQAFDNLLTASANFQWSVQGTVTRDNWSGSVNRSRDMTVSGMAGRETQRTWNGEGSSHTEAVFTGGAGTRTYTHDVQTTVANVVVAVPRALNNPWPLSGTLTADVTSTRPRFGGGTVDFTAVLTFNGTRFVPLDIGDRAFCFDLASRRVVAVDCR